MHKFIRKGCKYCLKCNKNFVGTIDATGRFCSTKCIEEFELSPSPKQTEKKQAVYPFHCSVCDKLIQTGHGSKAHRKGKCCKNCTLNRKYKQEPKKKKYRYKVKIEERFKKESEIKKELYGNGFYRTPEWLQLRYKALVKYGRKCQLCYTVNAVFHVDHIKPRSKHPELSLDIDNLQILCEACNRGKGAWDQTDWRPKVN